MWIIRNRRPCKRSAMYNENNHPALLAIVYIKGELNPKLPFLPMLQIIEVSAEKVKQELDVQGIGTDNCLMLAATDALIREAKELDMAVAGYVNPLLPPQTYYGVDMLIEGFEEVDEEFLLRIFQRHHGIPWRIAETERCVIREFSMEDMSELVELYEQPGITYRLDKAGRRCPGFIEPLYPMEEELEYQESYIRHMYRYYEYGMWLVLDRKTGQLIGRAGIENRSYPEGVEMELGYLIHPAWQHRGIATEVCSAIIHYARMHLECDRLSILTDETNTASVALAEKLGFVYKGDTDVSGSRTKKYELIL